MYAAGTPARRDRYRAVSATLYATVYGQRGMGGGERVGVREKTRRTRRVYVMFQQARPGGGAEELEKKFHC